MKAKKGEAKSVLVDAPEFPCCGFRTFRATIVSD
jgi:hypothetical protein